MTTITTSGRRAGKNTAHQEYVLSLPKSELLVVKEAMTVFLSNLRNLTEEGTHSERYRFAEDLLGKIIVKLREG